MRFGSFRPALRTLPPSRSVRSTLEPYVEPSVKRQKNDRADAEAIAAAAMRPTMRFLAMKNAVTLARSVAFRPISVSCGIARS